MKILKLLGTVVISLVCLGIIIVFEKNNWIVGSSFSGVILGVTIPALYRFMQDMKDTSSWKTSQRKLERGGLISDETIIRISFAYLYRIKVEDKYLLVRNKRNTDKYQPVGGVYKFKGIEKQELKNSFHVIDDNKIPIDESSRDDYRLRMENKFLRDFIKRFDSVFANRERIDNVGREFKEELVDDKILDWDSISYRYCGRHITDMKYSEHFQIYEILLYDVVELIPTPQQEKDLKKLMEKEDEKYRFATAEQIVCLGTNTESGNLKEWIGTHTKNTLQENEAELIQLPGVGEIYRVDL